MSSQSSDVFSNYSSIKSIPSVSEIVMDDYSYNSLLTKVKLDFDEIINKNIGSNNLANHFNLVFEDCRVCINQTLNTIQDLLKEEKFTKITNNLDDSVTLLQLLSISFKCLLEFDIMNCSTMKKMPLVTGELILSVFTHCKESESIYGTQLSIVEQQLKDLFRTCHELQLMYLMILEKHFVFNLIEFEELQILDGVLNVNLKIGGIVLDLSLKAMAEQWKAFSCLCNKYSSYLTDQHVYTEWAEYISTLIMDNVKTSLVENQDQKVTLRSLRVINFLLKIHMKVHQVLNQNTDTDYQILLNMFCYIKIYCKEYLEKQNRNIDFINMFQSNVMLPANIFIQELVTHKQFYESIHKSDIKNEKGDLKFGYLVLLLFIMNIIVEINEEQEVAKNCPVEIVVDEVFNILPYCKKWITRDFRFTVNNNKYSLLEHLIVRSSFLISLLDAEQFSLVECKMFESLLDTNTLVAVFAADLWILLSRFNNPKLRRDHLTFLYQTYTILSKNNHFYTSPQCVHLTSTIKRMFGFLNNDEKSIFAAENVLNDDNLELWSMLEVRNLPLDQCRQYERALLTKLRAGIKKVVSENYNPCDVDLLIKVINATSTCPLDKLDSSLRDDITDLWGRLCAANMTRGESSVKYVGALCHLVETLVVTGCINKHEIVKIMHVLHTMKHIPETKLLTINLVNKLTSLIDSKYPNVLNSTLSNIFKIMINDEEEIIKVKAYETILKFKETRNYSFIMELLKNNIDFETFVNNDMKITTHSEDVFTHKCLTDVIDITNSNSDNNFDLLDVGAIFEDMSEPASKKVKLNLTEADNVLERIEKDVDILWKMKENVFSERQEDKIRAICDKLKNIVT